MKKYNDKLLEEVPPDYYHKGLQKNLLQKIWHSWKWHSLNNLLLQAQGKLLDVGCAGGMITAKIKAAYPNLEVTGVDLYQQAIEYASKKYPAITFIRCDAHRLPFHTNTFDIVTTTETIEHLHNPKQAVSEIYRVLRPGGVFIVGQDTDNLFFKTIWWFWTRKTGKVWQGVHVSCMKPHQLQKLLIECKFKVTKKVYSHFGLEVFFKAIKPSL